jgi:hypothetical protein
MAELTDDDVYEMQRFLTGTCADVKRWLPEPEWRAKSQLRGHGEVMEPYRLAETCRSDRLPHFGAVHVMLQRPPKAVHRP